MLSTSGRWVRRRARGRTRRQARVLHIVMSPAFISPNYNPPFSEASAVRGQDEEGLSRSLQRSTTTLAPLFLPFNLDLRSAQHGPSHPCTFSNHQQPSMLSYKLSKLTPHPSHPLPRHACPSLSSRSTAGFVPFSAFPSATPFARLACHRFHTDLISHTSLPLAGNTKNKGGKMMSLINYRLKVTLLVVAVFI